MKKVVLLLLLCCSIGLQLMADPPIPPKGFRWVLNQEFSDEFNGSELDQKKWNNYFPGWEGRQPAMFNPEAVFVKNGNLEIKSGILKKAYKGYKYYGGAVTSKSKKAHFGYYECKAKASKIQMSTTFWMSNDKVAFEPTDYRGDSYSQELDIQECVGGGTTDERFRMGMNSNTHFRYVEKRGEREKFISKGLQTKVKSEVSEEYHIYGAWWKNANEVLFYADNEFSETVKVRTDVSEKPFDRPMQINMVTETYDWQPITNVNDLEDESINTARYDWIRSYKLVPISQVSGAVGDLFTENVTVSTLVKEETLLINCIVKSNSQRKLYIKVKDKDRNLVKEIVKDVYPGFGQYEIKLQCDGKFCTSKQYFVEANF